MNHYDKDVDSTAATKMLLTSGGTPTFVGRFVSDSAGSLHLHMASTQAYALSSVNGGNYWTKWTVTPATNTLAFLCYSSYANRFYAINTYSGANAIVYSTDPIYRPAINPSPNLTPWTAISGMTGFAAMYAAGAFVVAFKKNSNVMTYSLDGGLTWSTMTMPFTTHAKQNPDFMFYGNKMWYSAASPTLSTLWSLELK